MEHKRPARDAAQSANVPRVSRLESIAEIVGIVVMVGWLWFAFDRPSLLFGPVLDDYRLAPVWQQVALPTLLVLGVSVAQAVVNLFRPDWVRFSRVVRLVTDFAGLGILIYLLQADSWVVSPMATLRRAASMSTCATASRYRVGLRHRDSHGRLETHPWRAAAARTADTARVITSPPQMLGHARDGPLPNPSPKRERSQSVVRVWFCRGEGR